MKMTTRFGKSVPVDEAFEAWQTHDIERMERATKLKTNAVDRHHLLGQLVSRCIYTIKEPGMREKALHYSKLHVQELPELYPLLLKNNPRKPHIQAFMNLAGLLSDAGQLDDALAALRTGLDIGYFSLEEFNEYCARLQGDADD